MKQLLLEIGTEEIPASFLGPALVDLERRVRNALSENDITAGPAELFSTPRRLALRLNEVHRQTVLTEVAARGVKVREGLEACGRYAGRMHHFLGEGLVALDPRPALPGTEDLQALPFELVGRAGHQRCLRPDYRQVNLLPKRKPGQTREVRGRYWLALSDMRDPRIARGTNNLVPGSGEMPGKRVLAAPAADDQYSQCLSNLSNLAAFMAAAQLPKYRTAAACSVR